MNENDLKLHFRTAELQERSRRRRQFLLNEAALLGEPLTPTEERITQEALVAIRKHELAYRRATCPGYWPTLWLAIRGKLHGR